MYYMYLHSCKSYIVRFVAITIIQSACMDTKLSNIMITNMHVGLLIVTGKNYKFQLKLEAT